MKTAMQELIENLSSFVKEIDEKYDRDSLVKRGLLISINEARSFLQKERIQIIDAYNQGYRDGETDQAVTDKDVSQFQDADYYFNRIYNNQ